MKSRIYSETLPWTRLVAPETLALLRRYGLELVLAVRPWDIDPLPGVALTLQDAGIPLSIWPMLEDERGRWVNVQNAHEFRGFVRAIGDALARADVPARDVMFDLEPPFDRARALLALAMRSHTIDGLSALASELRRPRTATFEQAAAALAQARVEVHERGSTVSAAVWPMLALDARDVPPGRGWQALLGTPADALAADHVSVMMYSSIFEGWSRGTVKRRDARMLLAKATARTAARWGDRAGMSLGCVGTGAFEDEPVYRSPRELAEDVAIARAAGVNRLTLFDLGGVLARGPAEAWLDAFAGEGPGARDAEDAVTREAALVVRAARLLVLGATWALARPPR